MLLNQKRYKEAADSFESAFISRPASAEYAMAFANALVLWNRPNTLLAFLNSVQPRSARCRNFSTSSLSHITALPSFQTQSQL